MAAKHALAILALFLAIGPRSEAKAQSEDSDITAQDSAALNPRVITGSAFSATKSVRRVRNLPNGKQRFIAYEGYPMQIARDSEGRVRVKVVNYPPPDCDQPTAVVPPPCPVSEVILFDPANRTITHWPDGEIAAHIAVGVKLSPAQIEDAEGSTAEMPIQPPASGSNGTKVITEKVGGRVVEGLRASGIRTTTIFPAGYAGNKVSTTRIHEVWTSAEMHLIVQIVDGDPKGEETISSVAHVSTLPDPGLFSPPDGYELQFSKQSTYADGDMDQLAKWFIR